MDEQLITNELLKRYLQGKCSAAEQQLVTDFLDNPDNVAQLHRIMSEETAVLWDLPAQATRLHNEQIAHWQHCLHERMVREQCAPKAKEEQSVHTPAIFKMPPLRYTAAALLLVGLAGLLWLLTQQGEGGAQGMAQQENSMPGTDRAILQLSDGSTISLSDAANGKLVDEAGVSIRKTAAGEIIYTAAGKTASARSFNSIRTPNGGQYRITLPDGSRALLNAASSLTYPVEFEKNERRVKMTGEVYFEIAKVSNDSKQHVPFFVETDKQVIEVLGTTFNVNAYANEPYDCTTLVEGSVRLLATGSGKSELLKPGQQAMVGAAMQLSTADMQQNLAWVNGYFVFRREELGSILRKIARWYDVTVECPPELSSMKFTGKVSRSQSLAAVVEMISSINKVKLDIKERRIIVKQ